MLLELLFPTSGLVEVLSASDGMVCSWVGAAITAGGSLLGALLGGREARKSEQAQAKYNRAALLDEMRANQFGQNNALGSVTWRSNNPSDPFARTRHYEMSPVAKELFNQAMARLQASHRGSMEGQDPASRRSRRAAQIAQVIQLGRQIRR